MKTVRLTMAQALVRYLMAQKTEIDGDVVPLFPGVFAIFGHGNVTCLSEALEAGVSGQALIVADDAPAHWRDVFGYVAEAAGGPAPATGGRPGFPSFRVSNARARAMLNWTPRYPDYRAGLAR